MTFLDRIFRHLFASPARTTILPSSLDLHLVFVTVPPDRMPDPGLSEASPAVKLLIDQLEIAAEHLGTVRLNVRHGELTITASGPDADRLFAALEPVLRKSPLIPQAYVLLRYGEIGARERQVTL